MSRINIDEKYKNPRAISVPIETNFWKNLFYATIITTAILVSTNVVKGKGLESKLDNQRKSHQTELKSMIRNDSKNISDYVISYQDKVKDVSDDSLYRAELSYNDSIRCFFDGKTTISQVYLRDARRHTEISSYETILKNLLGDRYGEAPTLTSNERKSYMKLLVLGSLFNGTSIDGEDKNKKDLIKYVHMILRETTVSNNKP